MNGFHLRGADTYRPGTDGRGERNRHYSFDNGKEDRRHEQPEERRGRQPSDNTFRSESRRARSPHISSAAKGSRTRARSSSAVHTRLDTSGDLARSEYLELDPATGAQPSPISPGLSATLPSRQLLHDSQQPQNLPIVRSLSIKTTDPRLRGQSQQTTTPINMVASPTLSSTDDAQENQNQGSLVKKLTNAVMRRNKAKEELEQLKVKLRKLGDELVTAQRLFTKGNPYIDKIQEELRVTETAIKAQKESDREMAKKENSAITDLAAYTNNYDSLSIELQGVRGQLSEERNRSQQLRVSNDHLQQQIEHLHSRMNELGNQYAEQQRISNSKIQEQIDYLKTTTGTSAKDMSKNVSEAVRQQMAGIEEGFEKTRGKEMESLRIEFEAYKVGMARLNQFFATREDVQILTEQVKKFDEIASSASMHARTPPNTYLTQSQLDRYVAVFNDFETKTEKRFSDLEKRNITANLALEKTAKNDQIQKCEQDMATHRELLDDANNRIAKIEAIADQLSGTTQNHSERNQQLQESFDAAVHRETGLDQRVKVLEATQKSYQDAGIPQAQAQKLQQDVSSLKSLTQNMDRATRANSHSVNSLNQRFNNLTSEQLSRQMVGVLEPMLTTLKPQVSEMHGQFKDLQSQQHKTTNDLATANENTSNLRAIMDRLEKLNADLDSRMSSARHDINEARKVCAQFPTVEQGIQAMNKELVEVRTLNAGLADQVHKTMPQTLEALRVSIVDKMSKDIDLVQQRVNTAINALKDEYQTLNGQLIAQIQEARNGIDARLLVVEKEISKRHETTTNVKPDKHAKSQAEKRTTASTPRSNETNAVVRTASTTNHSKNAHKSNMSSKAKPAMVNSTQSSPLAKHFPSQVVDSSDELGDTIDATQKPSVNAHKRANGKEVISILDSDLDNDDLSDDSEQFYVNADLKVDIDQWKKAGHRHKAVVPGNGSKGGTSAPLETAQVPTDTIPPVKRKRDKSDSATKEGRHGSASGGSTPQSKQQVRKKTKT